MRLLRVEAMSPMARKEPRVIMIASVSRIGSSTRTPRWKPVKRYISDATASTSSEPSPTPRTTAARSRRPNVSHEREYSPDA